MTGTRTDDPQVLRALDGTLQLGVEDGILYIYDITLEGDGTDDRYTYDVKPAPFPDHDWVDRVRDVAATDGSSE